MINWTEFYAVSAIFQPCNGDQTNIQWADVRIFCKKKLYVIHVVGIQKLLKFHGQKEIRQIYINLQYTDKSVIRSEKNLNETKLFYENLYRKEKDYKSKKRP